MSSPVALGHVIARRELTARRVDNTERLVAVEVGTPVRPDDDGPWWCPFQVTGLGSGDVQGAAGEDSLQALLLALRYLAEMLPYDAERQGETITWFGEEDLGISL